MQVASRGTCRPLNKFRFLEAHYLCPLPSLHPLINKSAAIDTCLFTKLTPHLVATPTFQWPSTLWLLRTVLWLYTQTHWLSSALCVSCILCPSIQLFAVFYSSVLINCQSVLTLLLFVAATTLLINFPVRLHQQNHFRSNVFTFSILVFSLLILYNTSYS